MKAGLNPISVTADVASNAGRHHTNPSSDQSSSRDQDFNELSSDDEKEHDNDEQLSEGDPTLLVELDRLYDEPPEVEDEP